MHPARSYHGEGFAMQVFVAFGLGFFPDEEIIQT